MTTSSPNPPTMEDVARVAHCHPSTVSLALRGHPRIPAATRERVAAAAAQLGYRIHPMISAWVSARRARRPLEPRAGAAYLTCHCADNPPELEQHFRGIFEGARERAEDRGFSLSEFRLADYMRDLGRLGRVLVARGVQGLIVGPTLEQHELSGLDWDRFSLLTIGYGLETPALHRVTEDHYLGMKLAFQSCRAQGHRRIGLALLRQHNAGRRERWVGAYLHEQNRHVAPRDRLPIFFATGASPLSKARDWRRAHAPDIVLADDPAAWKDAGVATLGFALADAHPLTGVHENNREIGRHAADLLVHLILSNERGIPPVRQTVLVEPLLHPPASA